MNLTIDDLSQVRTLFREEVRTIVRDEVSALLDLKLEPILDKLETLENDIKEIYGMISELQRQAVPNEKFQKLTLKNKLLTINAELLMAAKEAGVTLPRS